MSFISIRGARQHNLKGVSVDIPREKLVVITGPSGSGKSSLAMDTIFAEGQRRYVESLSAYARQFLARLPKPEVDSIEGLSPSIAIDQRNAAKTPRSTVGTVSEIHDHLRLLFTHLGRPHCPACGQAVTAQTVQEMVDQILSAPEGSRLALLAPIFRERKGGLTRQMTRLRRDGFVRIRLDGKVRELEEQIKVDGRSKHTLEVFVDRLVCKARVRGRLTDSLETALRLGQGQALVAWSDGDETLLSETLSCARCNVSLPVLEPRLFSFNNPVGACPSCAGLGYEMVFSPSTVIGDPDRSITNGAILPWAKRGSSQIERLREVAPMLDIDLEASWRSLAVETKELILHGTDDKGLLRDADGFEGVIPWLERRLSEFQKRKRDAGTSEDELYGKVAKEFHRYLERQTCSECQGARLCREALAVKVGGIGISELSSMPVDRARSFVDGLALSESERTVAERILHEVGSRLGFLVDVGLDYLTLARSASTLSGGEAQRLRLATQIGAPLTGVLYVLDEPSVGLHQRDNERLFGTLTGLRDRGCSVLVVEHDPDTIREADWVIDMGPGAGVLGGEVVAEGTPKQIESQTSSLTGGYLSGRLSIPLPKTRRTPAGHWLRLRGASEHNLKNVTLKLPLGVMTCVTGVSGSGKSTLVVDTLLTALQGMLHKSGGKPGAHVGLEGAEHLDKVVAVDQAPIGRTPRSNPATYTGLLNPLRDLFSSLPEARAKGYGPARFSFNVKGGRCEACQGEGNVKVEMHFLPDLFVLCDHCGGRRYNRETLEIRYKGSSIADVLDLTVDEAAELLETIPPLRKKLTTLQSVGLGYIKLGQSATTLSGGEAQRVKLARELSRRASGRTLYLLDEPTTGLHQEDVRKLIEVLTRLVDTGSTVVVIEHHLDVIKCADWVIDLGPEGGERGGEIVAEGTPEKVARSLKSYTGAYLKKLMG